MPVATLPLWLALPALLFVLIVPGYITLQLLLAWGHPPLTPQTSLPERLHTRERVFLTVALGVMETGWLALLLAELGLFSIGLLLLILAGWAAACAGVLWRKGYRADWWRTRFGWKPGRLPGSLKAEGGALALLLLLATGLFFLAPHETILGSQDSGVYYNTGATIARTGSLIITDPLLQTVGQAANDPVIGPKVLQQVLQGTPGKEGRFLFVRYLRQPGFFVRNNEEGLQTGEVVPQFFHLYPAYLAVGYGLFGPRGPLLVMPLLGLLGVYAVYLTAFRLFPARRQRWIAPLAGLFLALNAVQVWFARQTLWEMLGQFLLFSGIYAFLLLLRPGDPDRPDQSGPGLATVGGAVAGLAFGLVCLAHAQFPFLVWPLIPYLLWMRLTRRWGAAQWWLLGTGGGLLLHSVLHIRLFSLPYFEGIYHNVIVDLQARLHLIIPPLAAMFFLYLLVDAMPGRVRALEEWVRRRWRFGAGGLAALALFYLLYNYFGRVYSFSTDGQGNYPTRFWSWSSYIGAPTTEGPERSLLRLGWYFSPVGMLLIFAGLGWLTALRLNSRTGFFLALVAGVSVLFIDTNYTQEHYIYALRRYVVITVPAFSILMAYALLEAAPEMLAGLRRWASLRRKQVVYAQTPGGPNIALAVYHSPAPVNSETEAPPVASATSASQPARSPAGWMRLPGLVAAGALLVFLGWTGRTIFTLSDYGAGDGQPGLITQMEQLASRFGPKDVLLLAGERDQDGKLATPLMYTYGHPSFSLVEALKNDEVAGLIGRWEAQGYHVKALLGQNGGRFAPPGYELKLAGDFTLTLRQLEQLSTQKPNNIQLNTLSYAIFDVQKIGDQATFAGSAGSGRVNTTDGWRLGAGQNDYASLISGFYGVEKDPDATPYRWSALGGVLRVPCLLPENGGGRLSVTLGGGLRPASKGPTSVEIHLSNYRYSNETGKWLSLGTVQLGPQPQTFSFELPPGAAALSCARSETGDPVNSLILFLDGAPRQVFVPASDLKDNFDQRQLSFKFYGMSLQGR